MLQLPIMQKKSTPKGRTGRQTRLIELGDEPKLGKADRGWIKQERNNLKRKKLTIIHTPQVRFLPILVAKKQQKVILIKKANCN